MSRATYPNDDDRRWQNIWRLFHLCWEGAMRGTYNKQNWQDLHLEVQKLPLGEARRDDQIRAIGLRYAFVVVQSRLEDWRRRAWEEHNVVPTETAYRRLQRYIATYHRLLARLRGQQKFTKQ